MPAVDEISDLLRCMDPVMKILARGHHRQSIIRIQDTVNGSVTELDAQKLFVKIALGSRLCVKTINFVISV